jgi:hypothetical protein
MTYGYRGGKSESELIRAAIALLDDTEADAVAKIQRSTGRWSISAKSCERAVAASSAPSVVGASTI